MKTWFWLFAIFCAASFSAGQYVGGKANPRSIKIVTKFRDIGKDRRYPWGLIEQIACYRVAKGIESLHGPTIEYSSDGDTITTTWYDEGKQLESTSTTFIGDPPDITE